MARYKTGTKANVHTCKHAHTHTHTLSLSLTYTHSGTQSKHITSCFIKIRLSIVLRLCTETVLPQLRIRLHDAVRLISIPINTTDLSDDTRRVTSNNDLNGSFIQSIIWNRLYCDLQKQDENKIQNIR